MTNQIKITQLIAYIHDDESKSFKANVEAVEEYEVNIAHPVYTGNMNAKGKLNTSRVYKSIHTSTRTKEVSEYVELSMGQFKSYYQFAQQNEMLPKPQVLENPFFHEKPEKPVVKMYIFNFCKALDNEFHIDAVNFNASDPQEGDH